MAALRGGREVTGPTRMVLGGYIMLALLTVFLTKVIDRLGVLDGPAIWLADWLVANIFATRYMNEARPVVGTEPGFGRGG
jgi:hypothetical protein